jgi:hypothetical protein
MLNQAQGPDARIGITDDDILNMTAEELMEAIGDEGSFYAS